MTYTYTAVRVMYALCAGVVAGFVGAGWMGLVERTVLETPGFVAFVAFIAVAVWRGATVKVVVDDKGFVVRNVVRTHRVAWTEVCKVKTCEPWWWSRFSRRLEYRCPCLVVHGRRPVQLLAMVDLGDHRYARVVKEWQRR